MRRRLFTSAYLILLFLSATAQGTENALRALFYFFALEGAIVLFGLFLLLVHFTWGISKRKTSITLLVFGLLLLSGVLVSLILVPGDWNTTLKFLSPCIIIALLTVFIGFMNYRKNQKEV